MYFSLCERNYFEYIVNIKNIMLYKVFAPIWIQWFR